MFSSVKGWLGVVDNKTEEENVTKDENKENEGENVEEKDKVKDSEKTTAETKEHGDDLLSADTKQTLEDVSAKAINTAKEWGSYLFSVGKQATSVVTDTAKQITKTVEDKTFLGDFSREQDKFISEKKGKQSEAAVPPWVGYNEEETMRTQIMALSSDKRNFLRNPPTGIQFQFDFDSTYPIAMATLQEDPNLQKMRFDLVPKQVNEETFWRNYFYRVSLIKQSTQLTSIAQQTGSTGESRSSDGSRRSSTSSSENKDKASPQVIRKQEKEEEIEPGSPQDNEFVSDTFQEGQISDEDLKKEMQMLGVEDIEKLRQEEGIGSDDEDWEKALVDEYLAMQNNK